MNFKNLIDKNWKNIFKGLIISLFISFLYIYGAINSEKIDDAIITVAMVQLGIATLWLVIRMGLFSTASYGSRNFAKSSVQNKNKKIGIYDSKDVKNHIRFKKNESPMELEEKARRKSKVPIYTMFVIGVIELIAALIKIYS